MDYVFAEKWSDAIENGAILGMVDFGELDHVRNADHKFWPSLGMSVAQTRNLYGLVYPLIGDRTACPHAPAGASPEWCGRASPAPSVSAGRRPATRCRPIAISAPIPARMFNLTLSGFSNVGQDIGGWDSKGPDILYARWFAAGTFSSVHVVARAGGP